MMARKRVTEEDLLNFRERADELSQVLEQKYERLKKAAKPAEETEEREQGILLIHHTDVDAAQVKKFVSAAKAAGFAAESVALRTERYGPAQNERVAVWQQLLEQAQAGYLRLGEHARGITVLGTGDSAALATIIAEQYPVEALMVVGAGPVMKLFAGNRTFSRLASLARNNLFSIVCPVFAITPDDCGAYIAASAGLYRESTRSNAVTLETVSHASVPQMWTEREQELEKRIFRFMKDL